MLSCVSGLSFSLYWWRMLKAVDKSAPWFAGKLLTFLSRTEFWFLWHRWHSSSYLSLTLFRKILWVICCGYLDDVILAVFTFPLHAGLHKGLCCRFFDLSSRDDRHRWQLLSHELYAFLLLTETSLQILGCGRQNTERSEHKKGSTTASCVHVRPSTWQ